MKRIISYGLTHYLLYKMTIFHREEPRLRISLQELSRSYLAVLLGPNCLAGEAEIQGFLPEAERETRHGDGLKFTLGNTVIL